MACDPYSNLLQSLQGLSDQERLSACGQRLEAVAFMFVHLCGAEGAAAALDHMAGRLRAAERLRLADGAAVNDNRITR